MSFAELKRKWKELPNGVYQASDLSDILGKYPCYDSSDEDFLENIIRNGFIRKDGSYAYFSILNGPERPLGISKCFKKKDSMESLNNRAMREEISPQIIFYLGTLKEPRCLHCGERVFLSSKGSFEVHHTNMSFNNMAKDFRSKFGMSKTTTHGKIIFLNESYSKNWIEFHREKASLSIVHKNCHDKIDHTNLNSYKEKEVFVDDTLDILLNIL